MDYYKAKMIARLVEEQECLLDSLEKLKKAQIPTLIVDEMKNLIANKDYPYFSMLVQESFKDKISEILELRLNELNKKIAES